MIKIKSLSVKKVCTEGSKNPGKGTFNIQWAEEQAGAFTRIENLSDILEKCDIKSHSL